MTNEISIYHDTEALKHIIAHQGHRAIVGGLWDELGQLQLDFLRSQGMQPQHKLLDIGCGSMRLGRLAGAYLEAGNYWGTDLSNDLLSAGWEQEIRPLGLELRLPRRNLLHDTEFTFAGLPSHFDYAIANSVFTHLPLNQMRLCFANLAAHLKADPGVQVSAPARVYFTFFMPTGDFAVNVPSPQKDGIVTYSWKDPFHYDWADIEHAFRGLPWRLRLIRDWGHPRNQLMVEAVFDKGGEA